MTPFSFSPRFVQAAFAAIVGVCFLLPTGCSKKSDPSIIKIVSSLPRTGTSRGQTNSITNGIKMVLEDAGYKAGSFNLVYEDWDDATAAAGQWDPGAETTNAKNAGSDPDVMVYIGTFNSGAAKISMPILNGVPLLMISPANTAIGLTKKSSVKGEPETYRPTGKINFVRVCPTDDYQGSFGADWAKSMGMKSVYVLDDNEMYGAGLGDIFEQHSKEIGLQVLGHDHINVRELDFKALMGKIKKTNPDLIYFGGTTQTQGGQLCKDMVSVGLKSKMMVPDGCKEMAFIEAAGESANENCYVTFAGLPFDQMGPPGKEFYEKYKQKYKDDPEAYSVYGYESGKVAVEAIKKAGKKDRQAIIDAALNLKDFEGALGKWSFDENGDTTLRDISGYIIRNGKFEFVKVLGK